MQDFCRLDILTFSFFMLLTAINLLTKNTLRINSLNTPDTWDCIDSKFIYPDAGHVITENFKVISDSRIRNIISMGPKYRFPNGIDLKKM